MGAHDNVVVGNNVFSNDLEGIAVYANAVGPVSNNVFIGNSLTNNGRRGISSGGYGHDPNKVAENNMFVGNFISGNAEEGVNIHHGATQGDVWMNNDNQDSWADDPKNNSAVAVFNPNDTPSAHKAVMV